MYRSKPVAELHNCGVLSGASPYCGAQPQLTTWVPAIEGQQPFTGRECPPYVCKTCPVLTSQTRSDLSYDPLITVFPSSLKHPHDNREACPRRVCRFTPAAVSQSFTGAARSWGPRTRSSIFRVSRIRCIQRVQQTQRTMLPHLTTIVFNSFTGIRSPAESLLKCAISQLILTPCIRRIL